MNYKLISHFFWAIFRALDNKLRNMEEDFIDDEIEESIAFNSQLVGYEGYQRRKFQPDVS